MGEVRFMISEAAKQVKVESHVLRYWEEELNLEIGRTEMGHRYYTKDDIQLFRCIKKLKDEGMLLKDLKPLIPELKATRLKLQNSEKSSTSNVKELKQPESKVTPIKVNAEAPVKNPVDTAVSKDEEVPKAAPAETAPSPVSAQASAAAAGTSDSDTTAPAKTDESALAVTNAEIIPITQLEQVRSLIGDVLTEVVASNNESLMQDISKTVTQDVMREMDYLFQAKERQEEEHFRKLDCLIRQQQANRKEAAHETPIGKLKKLLT